MKISSSINIEIAAEYPAIEKALSSIRSRLQLENVKNESPTTSSPINIKLSKSLEDSNGNGNDIQCLIPMNKSAFISKDSIVKVSINKLSLSNDIWSECKQERIKKRAFLLNLIEKKTREIMCCNKKPSHHNQTINKYHLTESEINSTCTVDKFVLSKNKLLKKIVLLWRALAEEKISLKLYYKSKTYG